MLRLGRLRLLRLSGLCLALRLRRLRLLRLSGLSLALRLLRGASVSRAGSEHDGQSEQGGSRFESPCPTAHADI